MNKALKLLPLLLCCLVLGGCSQEKKIRIGVSQCSNDDWRRKMNEEIMREAMFHDGVEVEIRSADDSNAKQIADLQYFSENGFDIILVAPNEETPLTAPINAIYNAGIPVVVYDRNIDNHQYTAFQGADNYEIGENVAQYINNYGTNLNIIEIQGLQNSSPAKLRHDGFKHKADSLGLNVLASAYGDWNLENARTLTDSLLHLYPQANVIYAHNDRMAIGASEVARTLGRDDIRIVGIDAAPTIGMQAVADTIIDATFLYPTEGDELIRMERRIELAMEGLRWFDLVRWGNVVETMNAYYASEVKIRSYYQGVKGVQITRNGNSHNPVVLVNVYNTMGVLVRSNIHRSNALADLPSGLYIVDGKKHLVR